MSVARKPGEDEPVDRLAHRSSEELHQSCEASLVGTLKRAEIAVALLISDDHRRIVGPDEAPVSQEAPNAPVPIGERVDALEAGMLLGDSEDRVRIGRLAASRNPVRHVGMIRWRCR